MKKRFLYLTSLLLSILLILASCVQVGDNTGGEDGEKPEKIAENTVFSPLALPTVVYDPDTTSPEEADGLRTLLSSLLGAQVAATTDDAPAAEREILLGRCDRALSESAYKRLERLTGDSEDKVGFIIRARGGSVAIAFDEEYQGVAVAKEAALEYFRTSYMTSDTLILPSGIYAEESFDPIAYQQEKDLIAVNADWEALRLELTEDVGASKADEIMRSLGELYFLFKDDVISWLANLYDPVAGGFYYSNSGRDTVMYGADLESTYQVLAFVSSSGMAEGLSSGAEIVPEKTAKQIVAFVKGLQNAENGYFYHPQWGKELTDSRLSRRGRDLTHATRLLQRFGASPTYDTPLGWKGDGLDAEGNPVREELSLPLGASTVTAVSKVIFANDPDAGVAPHLKTEEAFRAYLDTLPDFGAAPNNSYEVGNTLESQSNQIYARDLVLEGRGEDFRLCDILHEWLNAKQNPKTGLFTVTDVADYDGVNGLLKILSAYNGIHKEFPNPMKALESAVSVITSEADPETVCYVLNPWYAISIMFTNVTEYNTSKDKDAVEEAIRKLRADMLNNAPELIEATTAKTARFLKDDGSFSYQQNNSGPNSQGVPVAVANTNEGDVNATYMFIIGTPSHVFNILGYDMIPVYTVADRMRFFSILEELSPIIKDEELPPEPLDFESDELGDLPFEVTSSVSANSFVGVVEASRDGKENKALALTTVSGSNDIARFKVMDFAFSFNTVSYIADINLTPNNGSGTADIFFTNGAGRDVFRLIMDYTREEVSLRTLSDFPSKKIGKTGEWIELRIDYALTDIDYNRDGSADLLIKVYINGDLFGTAYTSNTETLYPASNIGGLRVATWSSSDMTLLFDNVYFMQTETVFDEAPEVNEEDGKELLTFEYSTDTNLPAAITPSLSDTGRLYIDETTDGKRLALSTAAGAGDRLKLSLTGGKEEFNAVIFEADVSVSSNSENGNFDLYHITSGGAYAYRLIFDYTSSGLTVRSPGSFAAVPVAQLDTTFRLRVEYSMTEIDYNLDGKADMLVKVYANGRLLGTGYYYENTSFSTDSIGGVRFQTWTSMDATVYLDNASLLRDTVVLDAPPVINEEDGNEIISFERSETDNLPAIVTPQLSEGGRLTVEELLRGEETTKALALYTASGLNDILLLTKTAEADPSNGVTFSFKVMLIPDAESTVGTVQMNLNRGSSFFFDTYLDYADGSVSVRISDKETYKNVSSVGEWLEITVKVYQKDASTAIIYYAVNGTELTEGVTLTTSNGINVDTLRVRTANETAGTIYFDDVCIKKETITPPVVEQPDPEPDPEPDPDPDPEPDPDPDPEPEVGSGELTFEDAQTGKLPTELTVTGSESAISVKESNGATGAVTKVLEVVTAKGGTSNRLELGITKEREDKCGIAAEFDLKLSSSMTTTSIVEMLSLYILSENNATAAKLSFGLNGNGGNLTVKLYSYDGSKESQVAGRTIASGARDKWVRLRIEYGKVDGESVLIRIYIGGELKLIHTLPYNAKNVMEANALTKIRLDTRNTEGSTFLFDNMLLERVDVSRTEAFDGRDSLPDGYIGTLNSEGASLTVEEVTVGEQTDTALAFTTKNGANDTLLINKTAGAVSFNSVRIALSLYVKPESESGTYELFLYRNGGAYYSAYLDYGAAGIYLRSSAGDFDTVRLGSVGEWVSFSFEVRTDTDATKMNLFVNGSLQFSDKPITVSQAKPASEVDGIYIRSYGSTAATLYIDDLLFEEATTSPYGE